MSAERGHQEDKGHRTLPCLLTEAWSVEGWRGLQLSPSSYLLSLKLVFIVMGVRTLFNFARKHVSTVDIISLEVCSKQVEGWSCSHNDEDVVVHVVTLSCGGDVRHDNSETTEPSTL